MNHSFAKSLFFSLTFTLRFKFTISASAVLMMLLSSACSSPESDQISSASLSSDASSVIKEESPRETRYYQMAKTADGSEEKILLRVIQHPMPISEIFGPTTDEDDPDALRQYFSITSSLDLLGRLAIDLDPELNGVRGELIDGVGPYASDPRFFDFTALEDAPSDGPGKMLPDGVFRFDTVTDKKQRLKKFVACVTSLNPDSSKTSHRLKGYHNITFMRFIYDDDSSRQFGNRPLAIQAGEGSDLKAEVYCKTLIIGPSEHIAFVQVDFSKGFLAGMRVKVVGLGYALISNQNSGRQTSLTSGYSYISLESIRVLPEAEYEKEFHIGSPYTNTQLLIGDDFAGAFGAMVIEETDTGLDDANGQSIKDPNLKIVSFGPISGKSREVLTNPDGAIRSTIEQGQMTGDVIVAQKTRKISVPYTECELEKGFSGCLSKLKAQVDSFTELFKIYSIGRQCGEKDPYGQPKLMNLFCNDDERDEVGSAQGALGLILAQVISFASEPGQASGIKKKFNEVKDFWKHEFSGLLIFERWHCQNTCDSDQASSSADQAAYMRIDEAIRRGDPESLFP